MFTSYLYHQKSAVTGKLSWLHKHANFRSLAVIMFVALGVLGGIGGKESEMKLSTSDERGNGSIAAAAPSAPSVLSRLWPVGRTLKSIKTAFNDPYLIEYANEQGTPDYPTALSSAPQQQSIAAQSQANQSR